MKPIANSSCLHTCPQVTPGGTAHVGGNITPSQSIVYVNNMPVIMQDDICTCAAGGPHKITLASTKVFIKGKGVARQNDPTGHQGMIQTGIIKVMIG